MLDALRIRIRLLLLASVAIGAAALSLVLFVIAIVGIALLVVWIGIPLVLQDAAVTKWLANVHRRYAGAFGEQPIDAPYLKPVSGGHPLVQLRALARDPARRRDLYWLGANGTLGLVLSIVAVVEGVLDLVFWWLPPALAARGYARLSQALLASSEKSRLALRVEQLTESRAETVDTQAVELRRIERDLHDGAQARLVALGMSLAMAEDQLDRDPDGARALLAEARTSSSAALSELRDLVRGIHPPVLADRGLAGAVQALALASPIPVTVRSSLAGRLSAPVESAAYFAVAEALTNVIKHSGASGATIELSEQRPELRMTVVDDGHGGADPAGGTGLRGIARRLSAFDGTLEVHSPHGGPTTVVMVLPCASFSPKISPFSATA